MVRPVPKRIALRTACLLAVCAVASASADASTSMVSTNWSGYAVTSKTGGSFKKVSGTWVVKKPDCATRSPSYSASWVGIGGFGEHAQSLEQIGTDADCSASGQRRYRAWYELLPADGRNLAMKIHAGDRISASVEVQGASVKLRLHNRTTGAKFAKTASTSAPDVTSAEWIVEAPSSCDEHDNCFILPLSDFGTVPFSGASVTMRNGTTKTISNSSFTAWRIKMRTAGTKAFSSDGATASLLSSGGTAFSVTYRRQVARPSNRARTLARSAAH